LQLSPGRLAEAAVLDFLKPVTEGKDKQVATDPRRFAVVEPPPFACDYVPDRGLLCPAMYLATALILILL
jgi:hypothetical protein